MCESTIFESFLKIIMEGAMVHCVWVGQTLVILVLWQDHEYYSVKVHVLVARFAASDYHAVWRGERQFCGWV